MSCPGDLYVVPGAAPCAGGGVTSIDGLTGAVAVTSNNGSITINNITGGLNLETTGGGGVTNSISSGVSIPITATTIGTSQIIATLQLIPTVASEINVNGTIVFTSNTNALFDLNYYIEMLLNGVVTVVGLPCATSIFAAGRFVTCPISVNVSNPGTNATFYLRAYASAASVLTVISSELTAIGNLTKTGGTQTTVALPVFNYGTAAIDGGAVLNCGAVTGLPTIDPALNPDVTFQLTMCGIGSTLFITGNSVEVGIYDGTNGVAFVSLGGTPTPPFNWGTTIPNALNEIVFTRTVPYATYAGGLNYYGFVNFPYSATPFYTITNLQFQLTVTYNA